MPLFAAAPWIFRVFYTHEQIWVVQVFFFLCSDFVRMTRSRRTHFLSFCPSHYSDRSDPQSEHAGFQNKKQTHTEKLLSLHPSSGSMSTGRHDCQVIQCGLVWTCDEMFLMLYTTFVLELRPELRLGEGGLQLILVWWLWNHGVRIPTHTISLGGIFVRDPRVQHCLWRWLITLSKTKVGLFRVGSRIGLQLFDWSYCEFPWFAGDRYFSIFSHLHIRV